MWPASLKYLLSGSLQKNSMSALQSTVSVLEAYLITSSLP